MSFQAFPMVHNSYTLFPRPWNHLKATEKSKIVINRENFYRREIHFYFLLSNHFLVSLNLNLNLTPNSRRRPVLPIPSLQQRPKNADTENRLRALKTGSLKINGISYETNVNDLEYLSELGNGTSGHVVKMRHKPSGAVIAVKASHNQSYESLIARPRS